MYTKPVRFNGSSPPFKVLLSHNFSHANFLTIQTGLKLGHFDIFDMLFPFLAFFKVPLTFPNFFSLIKSTSFRPNYLSEKIISIDKIPALR